MAQQVAFNHNVEHELYDAKNEEGIIKKYIFGRETSLVKKMEDTLVLRFEKT